jgi:TPR repeat protein
MREGVVSQQTFPTRWLAGTRKAVLYGTYFGLFASMACGIQSQTPFVEVQRAAEAGDANAQSALGVKYEAGEEVNQDFRQSASWFRLAAEQGNAEAQFNLGVLYAKGEGLPQSVQQAAR